MGLTANVGSDLSYRRVFYHFLRQTISVVLARCRIRRRTFTRCGKASQEHQPHGTARNQNRRRTLHGAELHYEDRTAVAYLYHSRPTLCRPHTAAVEDFPFHVETQRTVRAVVNTDVARGRVAVVTPAACQLSRSPPLHAERIQPSGRVYSPDTSILGLVALVMFLQPLGRHPQRILVQ